ncbi:MAG: gliding motility-associated protein GldE [Saprospiraceae bacterium]|nr:gliding motility-associated protein GldE [Saprospiraceae bacterium]
MESEPGSSDRFTSLAFFPFLIIPGVEIGIALSLVILFLVFSALVSGSEVAYFSLSTSDFDRLRQEKSKSSERILYLQERPRTLLATILIANNFINIAIVILSEFIVRQSLPDDLLETWSSTLLTKVGIENASYIPTVSWTINFLLTVVAATFLLVLFGEVIPKVYARLNNIPLARFMSGPLYVLNILFKPLSKSLVSGTRFIEQRLASKSNGMPVASKEDIDEAIELTVSQEKNAEQEVDLLKSIVKFGDLQVKQIMRSRVDVVGIENQMTFNEVIKIIKESGYSRLPVFEEDFDNVKGILYVKDLIGNLDQNDFEWQTLVRHTTLFVPESKKINDLLKEFQSSRMHLAIVVDEYGGSAGIVTLEDIMEEVIGDIRDEFDDEPEIQYRKIDDFNYLFEGKSLLNDVCRIVGIPTDSFDEMKGEADSIAGLVLELLGHLPKPEREISFLDYKLKVIAVNERRIEQVMLTLPQ